MEQTLQGRVALVTGVSRRIGIGYGIVSQLAQRGADVFIQSWAPFDASTPWGADQGGIDAVLSGLRAYGTRVEHTVADFLDPAAPAQVVNAAVAAFKHVDILIANHAYSISDSLEQLTASNIDTHLAVNVRGTLLLIKEWAAQHDGRAGGRVIMMTSGQHSGPMPGELSYIASKAALHGLTQSLSGALIGRGITVNTVNPGPTDTGYASPDVYQAVLERSPQGRWGKPEDAARLIAWLVSSEGQWVTGQVINSTGGL